MYKKIILNIIIYIILKNKIYYNIILKNHEVYSCIHEVKR